MKGYIISGLVVVIILSGVGYYWYRSSNVSPYITTAVKRGQIVEQVSARGNVSSPSTINLQFQNSGKITFFGVKVGDKVKAGEVLVRQDMSVLKAQLKQAQALVDSQVAQLELLKSGTRQEQMAVTESQIKSDKASVAQSSQDVVNTIKNAYTISDDAIHNKVDQIMTSPKTSNPTLIVTTNNSQTSNKLITDRVSIESVLSSWKNNISNLSSLTIDLLSIGMDAQNNLILISQFLSDVNTVLNSAVPTATESQTSINTWITNVSLARTNIDTVTSSLNTAITSLKNSLAVLDRDEKSLKLEQAGATEGSIKGQEALVGQARANVSAIEAQLKQMELISPVTGIVTQINGNVGEVSSPNITAVSIIPTSKLQIDVNLSEENIANVKVGDRVEISLTSFPSTKWEGTVSQIDPAQTVIGGAIYYKTKVIFNESDSRIKSGMTANVLIETGVATSTLILPASALETNEIKTTVKVLKDEIATDRNIVTGLKSQDGMVEIISGLSEGELVVTGTK